MGKVTVMKKGRRETPKDKALEVMHTAACKIGTLAIAVKQSSGEDMGPGLHYMLEDVSNDLLDTYEAIAKEA